MTLTPIEEAIEEARERERRGIYRPPVPGQQDGDTFIEARDGRRLNRLMYHLISIMEPRVGDDVGKWFMPDQLEEATGKGYASIQARLRDTRKVKFNCPWYAQNKFIAHGLYAWRLIDKKGSTYWVEIMKLPLADYRKAE